MRKIGFIPCRGTQKEILPKSYAVEQRHERRKMLIAMINDSLPEAARFSSADNGQYRQTVPEIFDDRIRSFFQCHRLRPERPQRVVRIYTHESLLFERYFSRSSHPMGRYFARNSPGSGEFRMLLGYDHPAAQLIALIFDGREVRMMLDLDTLFAHTVFRRIRREPSKTITLDPPYIHIDQHGVKTRLHPRWKQVDPRRLEQRREDIEQGLQQLKHDGIDQCYLVYPKTERFQRHIQIKNGETDQLKMIPYSFTFSQKEKKSCRK